jgi:hypothetical protein
MAITARGPISRGFHFPALVKLGRRRLLLACGVAATALYIGGDALAATVYDGYSYKDQTISELSAIGAPTRTLWMPVGYGFAVLLLAFASGVWMSAGGSRRLRAAAVLTGVIGAGGLVAWPLAPMHQRETLAAGGGDWRDTMHLALGGFDMLLFFGGLALAAAALRGRFRAYSIATALVVLTFGTMTGILSPGVQDNEATPWLGIYERVMLFGAWFWYAALAVRLWGRESRTL